MTTFSGKGFNRENVVEADLFLSWWISYNAVGRCVNAQEDCSSFNPREL
jgi:hypothetical protein